jgi:hypothetical protein
LLEAMRVVTSVEMVRELAVLRRVLLDVGVEKQHGNHTVVMSSELIEGV